jgi:hypothetical protein
MEYIEEYFIKTEIPSKYLEKFQDTSIKFIKFIKLKGLLVN